MQARCSDGARESVVRNAALIEPLEHRQLFSFIAWENRGDDNFGIYGANAEIARRIVDRAIWEWQRIIVNFNYASGQNRYNLDIRAGQLQGRGETNDITRDAQRKPTSANIVLDDDAAGLLGGWYFDPSPGSEYGPDDSEFTNYRGLFSADAPIVGSDFYRTVVHEIGHAMGLGLGNGLRINDFLADSGIDDPRDPGTATIRWIDFGFGEVGTMTEAGGGHLYEGPTLPGVNVVHPDDLMNDGRTTPGGLCRRQLINDTHAFILQQAYGYTMLQPSQINTFLVNIDYINSRTIVRGLPGASNDSISAYHLHPFMLYDVNGIREQVYSHHTLSLRIEPGDGQDYVQIYSLPDNLPAEVNSGNGNDTTVIGNGDIDSELLRGVVVNGGAGIDTLRFHDHVEHNPSSDHYNLNRLTGDPTGGIFNKDSWTLACSYTGFEQLKMYTSNQGGTNHVRYVPANVSLEIFDGTASTVYLVGDGDYDSNILGNVAINGGSGTDTIEIHDQNDTGNDIYTVTNTTFSKNSGGGTTSFSAVDYLIVYGSNGSNLYTINSSAGSMAYYIEAGGGNDQLNAGAGSMNDIRGLVNFDGNGGIDTLRLVDDGNSDNDGYWFSANAMNAGDVVDVSYQSIEALALRATTGNNNIEITGTPNGVPLSIFANDGTDSINVSGASPTGPVTIEPSIGDDSVTVTGATAVVKFAATQRIGALTVNNGAAAQLAAGAGSMVLTASSVNVAGTGRLDLTDENLVIKYAGASPLPSIRAQLAAGFAGGAWNGNGIFSSVAAITPKHALAYGEASALPTIPAVFGSVTAPAVLVRYTVYGDADLSGKVNVNDFTRMAANFGSSGTVWTQGNFNYDNVTNVNDFTLLAGNFGLSSAANGSLFSDVRAIAETKDQPRAMLG